MAEDVMIVSDQTQDLGTVVVLNRDLFFGVRLRELLTGAGYRVVIVPNTATFVERIKADPDAFTLGLIDMGAGVDWAEIQGLDNAETQRPPLLVFGPHKDVDGFRAAKNSGVDRIVANSEFHRNALGLVQRYARGNPRA
ncbi:MAG TPA: hypothetical protein VFL82_13050 [Thermomicrobiales bacterium]|nr:hypothetical protein [Thermomicrobiales bacterium]